MKKIMFGLLVLSALIIAGCTDPEPQTRSFLGGSQGLEISFLPDAPPETVSDQRQQDFDVYVELKNRGEYEIPPNRVLVKLSGFRAEAFGLSSTDLTKTASEPIYARVLSPDGRTIDPPESYVTFEMLSYQDAAIGAGTRFPFRVDVCYGYETTAASSLCVKENMNIDRAGDLCNVDSTRSLSVSGAPIQVTSMQQSRAGTDRTRFTFTVQDKGPGDVFRSESACEQATRIENRVFITVEGLPGENVNCIGLMEGTSNAGYIILSGKEPKDISCIYTVTDRNNRIEPFNVRLAYDYSQSITRQVNVEHHPLG